MRLPARRMKHLSLLAAGLFAGLFIGAILLGKFASNPVGNVAEFLLLLAATASLVSAMLAAEAERTP